MINTYNESSLHKTLKTLYAANYNGLTEQKVDSYICDILSENGDIIEIQTANLCKLLPKVLSLLPEHNIRIVYPFITRKYIETSFNGIISRRKSPKKSNIYSIFDELMGIWPLLNEKNYSGKKFILEIVFIEMTELRTKTEDPVQSKNKRRRFYKNWIKTGKRIDKIENSELFSCTADYLAILPESLCNPFCAKDLSIAGAGKFSHKIIWTLNKAEIINYEGKKGRTNYYSYKKY